MLRWVTTRAINGADVRQLVKFLSTNPLFKSRTYHVHTGAHCKDGAIGTVQPAFSLFDMQTLFDSNLSAGVMQINNVDMLPKYEWSVDYIDAMCFSNRYKAKIPTVQKMSLRDLTSEA